MALITPSNQIPGFHCQPTLFDLQNSTDAYNALVDSEELRSEISTTHLQNLAEIFVKYNVHERLGIHLIHSHAKVAAGHVMLGHSFTEPSGRWTKPIPIEEVNLAAVHGHIFKLVDGDRFIAYEYVEGRANDFSDIDASFFKELVECLRCNGLDTAVGLQTLGQVAENMVEFDFGDCGTVMLKDQDTCHGNLFRTTGWVFTCHDGVVSFKGNESHAETKQGPHKVFIDGKLAPNIPALKAILKRFEVIN